MEKQNGTAVPRSIFVLIAIVLVAMFCYAQYFDIPAPEKTVQNLYQGYFSRNYDEVAENLSVFWAVAYLPQYSSLSPAELLENRSKIEADIASTLAEAQKDNQLPKNVKVEIMKDYTKEGENSALAVYSFKQDGKTDGMEAAIMIREKGQFRIFTTTPVTSETLEQLKAIDVKVLDESFAGLLQ